MPVLVEAQEPVAMVQAVVQGPVALDRE